MLHVAASQVALVTLLELDLEIKTKGGAEGELAKAPERRRSFSSACMRRGRSSRAQRAAPSKRLSHLSGGWPHWHRGALTVLADIRAALRAYELAYVLQHTHL